MKTIITLLTATVLVGGATAAQAYDRQGSEEAANYELSWKAAPYAGAYGSARGPVVSHGLMPSTTDFQAGGR